VTVTDEGGQPAYRVSHAGQEIIAPSGLGFQFERYQRLGPGMAILESKRRSGEDRYTMPAAKTSSVRDGYNEISLAFGESGGEKRRLNIIVRAYDDGVAIRYHLPAQPAIRELRLFTDNTQFAFPADYDCHGFNVGKYTSSHEGEFDPMKASSVRAHHLYDLPVVCRTGRGDTTLAIAEADLRDFAGMYLSGPEAGGVKLESRLAPRADESSIAVKLPVGPDGIVTPWRVIMIGDHPGRLIESTLITSLNPPAAGDFSWVKPGKSAWDWWNGPSLSGVAKAGMNDETMKAFINFAAENGLEYMLIDDGWYVNSGGGGGLFPGADNMRAVPELNLSELVRYAAQRKVGIWVWVHWKLMDANMDVSLPHYAKLGIKGVKVDFMDRHDQQMVDFYLRLIRTAAANKLMIDLHGAYPPTGLIRTYPNYITQEGVLGAEYNKWSRRITATHNVTLPFTRGLLGPYDYTPGGFGNATPETFVIQNLLPMVQTTRGHGLAMYVVYDSPFQGVSDSPDRYRNQPGLDFIKLVPAAWDETRVLSGAIGEYVVIARRKGKDWFVGAMTNEQARTIEVPLTFLEGRAEATIWRDGADPTALVTDKRAISAADTLSLPLAGSGGAAIMLKRK
jgi:alpha-glucosidase